MHIIKDNTVVKSTFFIFLDFNCYYLIDLFLFPNKHKKA